MRKLSFLVASFLIFLISCQKSSVKPETVKENVISADATGNPFLSEGPIDRKTATEKLCTHTWMYQRYYIGYVDPNNLGILAYKRGGSNNTIDLDYILITYYPDGTSSENSNGNIIYGNWYFTDETATKIVFSNYTGVYNTTILKLTNKTFAWYYTDIYGVNRAGQYVPFN